MKKNSVLISFPDISILTIYDRKIWNTIYDRKIAAIAKRPPHWKK
jgi:hypothetical protein